MAEYKAGDVERILGVKRLRLHTWIERGFFHPGQKVGGGAGNPNLYDEFDLWNIALLKYLIDAGMARALAGEVMGSISLKGYADYFQKVKGYPLWLVVVTDRGRFVRSWTHIPGGASSATMGPVGSKTPDKLEAQINQELAKNKNGQVMLFDLGRIVSSVNKKMT